MHGALSLSLVWLFTAPWTLSRQAPLPREFSRQECWSWVSFPTPGDLPNPGIEPESLAFPVSAGRFSTINAPKFSLCITLKSAENWTSVVALIHDFFSKLSPYNHDFILYHCLNFIFYCIFIYVVVRNILYFSISTHNCEYFLASFYVLLKSYLETEIIILIFKM